MASVMTSSELAVIMSQISTSRLLRTGVPQIPYLFFHIHHCWLEISIVTTLIGDTKNQTRMAKFSRIGRREMITISYTTPNNEALFTQQGGNMTIHLISAGSQSTVDPNQPPVLCLRTFLTVSIDHPCWSPLTSHERHQQTSMEFQESRLA